jgi:hypothetical protein
MSKRIAALFFLVVSAVSAQEVYAYVGVGSAYDSSNGEKFDTFGDGVLHDTGGIGGVFGDFGLGVQLKKSFGAAFDIGWRAPQGVYAGMHYRPTLYSFDAVIVPARLKTRRSLTEFRLGIGGEKTGFSSEDQQNCVLAGPLCANSDHFQVHFGVAPRFYLNHHFFLRPAVDLHYVNHFSQFGTGLVTRYTLSLGYSLGGD